MSIVIAPEAGPGVPHGDRFGAEISLRRQCRTSRAKTVNHHAADGTDNAPSAVRAASTAAPDAGSHAGESKAAQPASKEGTPTADKRTPSQQQLGQPPATTTAQPSSVLFVDARVSGWQTLAASVSSDTKVVIIDGSTDGITQVTTALEGLRNVDRLDYLTYGRPGQIEFGASTVDGGTLQANAGQIAAWRDC
jgi:Domain of unknown function (DUF4347)